MITGRSESLLLSNLGWVDRGSIWFHDTETSMTSRIAIGEADFVRLHRGRDDLFAAALVR